MYFEESQHLTSTKDSLNAKYLWSVSYKQNVKMNINVMQRSTKYACQKYILVPNEKKNHILKANFELLMQSRIPGYVCIYFFNIQLKAMQTFD